MLVPIQTAVTEGLTRVTGTVTALVAVPTQPVTVLVPATVYVVVTVGVQVTGVPVVAERKVAGVHT